MRKLIASAFIALLLLAGRASAGTASAAGTSGAPFLKLGAGARAAAMADTFTAVADDAFAAYYNPAGLARQEKKQFGGSHSALFQGVSYQSLVFAVPFGKAEGRERIETESNRHALALSIYYLGVGEVERRTGDSTLPVGTFDAADSAYALSYSHAPNDRLSLGVTGKYITQTIDTYRGSAMAADLGVMYRANPHNEKPLNIALAVRHIGKRIGFTAAQTDPLPTTLIAGASYAPSKAFTVAADLGKARDASAYGSLGLEGRKSLSEGVGGAFRFGYTSARRDNGGLAGVTAGGGLQFQKAAFDFAWIPFGTLGDAFRFSLLVKF
ncbi:MAG: PorV/PorQ family protein [Elusimicrobiota bacterium]|nr:MAG: PorV/PorQ family protein [Elusimicrobiota bacterium]